MVVAALIQLAVAAPIGALFGAAYGTSIRIGYEIIFPALFKDREPTKDAQGVLSAMTTMFTGVGGLEAQNFGINQGVKNALKAIDADPELTALIKKNSNLDTQTITINLSGTSTQASSEQSQSSLSNIDTIPDTTGGKADRINQMKHALGIAKANNDRAAASIIYRQALQLTTLPLANLRALVNQGLTEHFNLKWNFALMDSALQRDMFFLLQNFSDTSGSLSKTSVADKAIETQRAQILRDRTARDKFLAEEKLKLAAKPTRDAQLRAVGITSTMRQAFFKWFNTQKKWKDVRSRAGVTSLARHNIDKLYQALLAKLKTKADFSKYASWFRITGGQL